jgi:hypothetical protein
MSVTKETNRELIADKRERLFNQPIVLSELSREDFNFIHVKMAEMTATGKLPEKSKKAKVEDGEKKPDKLAAFRALRQLAKEKLESLHLRSAGTWEQKFTSYLKSKGYEEDPSKFDDDDEFIRLYHRYISKPEGALPEPKAKKVVAKKVVKPDSEDEAEPKTTGGAKSKAVVDGREATLVRSSTANDSEAEEESKPKPVVKAPPKPPTKAAPKPKVEDGLKTPPQEGALVQTYKGKELYTALTEGAIHVWLNDDGAAGEYLGIYNAKTKEVEEPEE